MFDEVQLDPQISYGAVGGPKYKTTIVPSDSGFETNIGQWVNGRMSWNISSGVKSQAQMLALISFFRARRGKARGFRYKDWTDYKCSREHFWDGTTVPVVRLLKTYPDVVNPEVRLIRKPVIGTVVIYNVPTGGVPLVSGTDYVLDFTTGILTGLAAGHNYYWTGQFDTPMRFDTDDMQVNLADFASRNWDSIPLIEMFLRDP